MTIEGASSVPQAGERLVYVLEPGVVEAHIEIRVDAGGGPAQFAWLVPVQGVPELAVGSQTFFDQLDETTAPRFSYQASYLDGCGTGDGGGDGAADGGGPEVVLRDTVGVFEVAVLQGGTANEVLTWLAANGYAQNPQLEPILSEYLTEGFLFAAFKLTTGASQDTVHPLVLRIPQATEACVPLRLTRIAALDDMDVRVFFLAEGRTVPTNYRHIVPNWAALDWFDAGTSWQALVAAAANEAGADGRAFVTEYAGPTPDLAETQAVVWSDSWDATAFADVAAVDVIDLLETQGLASCPGEQLPCEYAGPQVLALLRQYLPAPDGVLEDDFYACLSCYADMIDAAAWDPAAFAAALDERVVAPGARANELLTSWPYLTRLYTRISPAEMLADPLFAVNFDLPDVDLRALQIQGGPFGGDGCEDGFDGLVFTLPDQRQVATSLDPVWPQLSGFPAAERVEDLSLPGAAVALVDNGELVDELLREHNCIYDFPSADACGGEAGETGGGCGCANDPDRDSWWWGLWLLIACRRASSSPGSARA